MKTKKQRLDYFRKINGLKYAELIGDETIVTPENLRVTMARENDKSDYYLKIIANKHNISERWLINGEGEMYLENKKEIKNFENLKEKNYSNTLEVKVVTTKARAGFADSYYSEEYLKDLPSVLIEADKEYKGRYLAFEVDGDSMQPDYNKGDIVICREIQRSLWQYKLHYKDYDFVIAHGTQGIMLKEIINHNPETGDIVCHSLNQEDGINQDFTLNLKEVAFLYNVVEHRISGKSKRRNR
ncbi:S24 family peptidase [Chryseobacterium aquaticum]|uniref:Peptidase S24/S26A/S26B/S26C domain-containing protein n=1 Tax=Chryseobacterium aquaticum subsp. greenlandense TaxID=345663 RepID=A0A101CDF9_9FLAO|nr:S24 family peptidase [Chryseobacterium aquaticum]KUJ53995.1 hypothetical protein AR686_17565 [Chryseobacterium aquaticum subsp. greenlandense]